MQATLIFNSNSGGAEKVTPDTIMEALIHAGFQPVYKATTSEDDLDQALRDPLGLVVVAGGDGSFRAVATRLIGKKVPLALLPLGTANNIARTLGIEAKPLEVAAALADPEKCYMDIGMVTAPWGVDYFMEAFGFGLYAEALAAYEPEKGKSVLRSISSLTEVLGKYEAPHIRMELDGQDLSGEYLLLEILNTPAFGPRLKVAPDADPADGKIELVSVRADRRESLMRYFTKLLKEELEELDSVERRTGNELRIAWDGFKLHVDAEVRPEKTRASRISNRRPALGRRIVQFLWNKNEVRVKMLPRALEIWVPKPALDKDVNRDPAESVKPDAVYNPDGWRMLLGL